MKADEKIPLDVIAKIREEIEALPLLQKIDLVDFARVPEEFSEVAGSNMELIYEQ